MQLVFKVERVVMFVVLFYSSGLRLVGKAVVGSGLKVERAIYRWAATCQLAVFFQLSKVIG